MKTVLFATTALVATAGIAAADVELSGFAEMGVVGGDDVETQFHTDIDATFTMTGETDGGLTFGANIDIDEIDGDEENSSAAFSPDTQGGESIFVSGAFGTLTMGDTDGALDWALQEAIIGSAINDDHEHAGYNGNAGLDGTYDGQIARYEYAFADFSVAVSGEIDDDADDNGDPVLGLGVKYATEFSGIGMAFGAGVQTIGGLDDIADRIADDLGIDEEDLPDDITIFGLSADLDFAGGFRVILNYSDYDDIGDHYGIAVGYTMDALTVAANYGNFDNSDVADTDGYGLVANYDLGGGAELQAGYGHSDVDGGEDSDTYSFGVAMSF
jgi:outer membrane protein OmpU